MLPDSLQISQTGSPLKGFIYAILSCFYWGIVFVIPAFISGFHNGEIVLFRYSIYGIFSLIAALFTSRHMFTAFPIQIWKKALFWSTLINPIYYFGITLSVRWAGPAITVIIAGLAPIGVLIYSNTKKKELSLPTLSGIVIITFLGVVLSNISEFRGETSSLLIQKILGVLIVLASTGIWILYVIHNENSLKCHEKMTPEIWSRMFGVCSLLVCSLILILANCFHFLDTKQSFTLATKEQTILFLILTSVMGTFSSGYAISLWNKASLSLSPPVLGSMLILEPLFGLTLSFLLVNKCFPSLLESTGIFLMLSGSLLGTILFSRKSKNCELSHANNKEAEELINS